MKKNFFQRFRRITYSTDYLPQIDGLRFVAVFCVVVLLHTIHFVDEKFYGNALEQNTFWSNLVLEGGHGVGLFFMISGFILSLPFARWRLKNGRPVVLRRYYLRRLTRLEPPYLIILLILFAAEVWIIKSTTVFELLPHLGASAVYQHLVLYRGLSPILPISWSLEIEVQFYILAPLFFLLFRIRSRIWRRGILLLAILAGLPFWTANLYNWFLVCYLHLFFCGMLLADLYCNDAELIRNPRWGCIAALASLAVLFFVPSFHFFPGYLLKLPCLFLLMHTALTNPFMKKLFSLKPLVLIGGMCYSIYLLHFALLSALGKLFNRLGLLSPSWAWFFPLVLLLAVFVLLFSAAYFLLVEKPFMRKRN